MSRLTEQVEARLSSQDLTIAEYETDKIQQLELEELNQQTFDCLRAEIKGLWNRTTEDVGNIKSYTTRSLDALHGAFDELRRSVENDRLTTAQKSKIHATIESNVMKTCVTTLEAHMNREISNIKLDVKRGLTETERYGVKQSVKMQGLEEKIHMQQQQLFEVEKSQAKLSLLYPNDDKIGEAVGGGVPGHRLSVIDFTLKGVVDRLNNLENEIKVRDEKYEKKMREGVKIMEDIKEGIIEELKIEIERGRKESEKIVVEAKQNIGRMIFDFERTSSANLTEMNSQALRVAQEASRRSESACSYMRKSLDIMETKIGRVRIDFDRMIGDTTSACEALADGLRGVRNDVRGVGGKLVAFEKFMVERGGIGNGGMGGGGGGIGGGGGLGGGGGYGGGGIGGGGYGGFR